MAEQTHRQSKGINIGGDNKTQAELFNECFYYLNSYKRHRALSHIKRQAGDRDQGNFHELKAYQFIDSLELGLRALQSGHRTLMDEIESE